MAPKLSSKMSQKVFFFMNQIDNMIFSQIMKRFLKFRKSNKNLFVMAFIFTSILMVVAHVGIFLNQKNDNLFQIMGVNRIVTEEQLDEQYTLKINEFHSQKLKSTDPYEMQQIQEKTQLIKAIHQVLKSSLRKRVYDKYLEISDEVNQRYLSPENTIMRIIQSAGMYMMLMLGLLINSDKQQMKASIKWVLLSLILFILIEIDMIIGETDEKDFIDIILPQITIAERGEILKVIIIPFMLVIKNFFAYFYINIEDKALTVLIEIPHYQEAIRVEIMNIVENISGNDEEKRQELLNQFEEILQKEAQSYEKLIQLTKNFCKVQVKEINHKYLLPKVEMKFAQLEAQKKQEKMHENKQDKKNTQEKGSQLKSNNTPNKNDNANQKSEQTLEELQKEMEDKKEQKEKKTDFSQYLIFILVGFILFQDDIKEYF